VAKTVIFHGFGGSLFQQKQQESRVKSFLESVIGIPYIILIGNIGVNNLIPNLE